MEAGAGKGKRVIGYKRNLAGLSFQMDQMNRDKDIMLFIAKTAKFIGVTMDKLDILLPSWIDPEASQRVYTKDMERGAVRQQQQQQADRVVKGPGLQIVDGSNYNPIIGQIAASACMVLITVGGSSLP